MASITTHIHADGFSTSAEATKGQSLLERVNALDEEVRWLAKQLDAAGAATAAAAATILRLKESTNRRADVEHSLSKLVVSSGTERSPVTLAVPSRIPPALPSSSSASAVSAPVSSETGTSTPLLVNAPVLPTKAASTQCASGCEKFGVCNTELGRCDCQPFMGGDDCSKPLISACAGSVGLKVVSPAPCVYDQMGMDTPVSCECLMGCEALGLMGVRECYVMDPTNVSVSEWVKNQRSVRGLDANMEYWGAVVKIAGAESLEKCGGKGLFVQRMPRSGLPARHSQKR